MKTLLTFLLLAPLQATTWHVTPWQESPLTFNVSNLDTTVLPDGSQLTAYMLRGTHHNNENFQRLQLNLSSADGRTQETVDQISTGATDSLLNFPVRIASGGGRTWLLWGDISPKSVHLAEVNPQTARITSRELVGVASNWSESFDLAIDDDGQPYLVAVNRYINGLEIARRNAAGTWTNTALPLTTVGNYFNPAIAVRNGIAHVAYTYKNGNDIEYRYLTTTNTGGGFSIASNSVISANSSATVLGNATRKRLTLSPAGIPALIFRDTIADAGRLARLSPTFGWVLTDLPSLGNSPVAYYNDIACSPNGTYQMVWTNSSSDLSYATTSSTSAIAPIVGEILPQNPSTTQIAVAAGPSKNPAIAYARRFVVSQLDTNQIDTVMPFDLTDLDANGYTVIEEEARLDRKISLNRPPGPAFTFDNVLGQSYPHLTFETVVGGQDIGTSGYYTANLLYQVQSSTDLVNWSSSGILRGDTFLVNGRRITSYRTDQTKTGAARQFMRISVARP